MNKLGIGIIGCGNISASYLRLAPLFKGVNVVAVADLNMDLAKARAEEFNTKAQSVEDLLANKDIDVVSVVRYLTVNLWDSMPRHN